MVWALFSLLLLATGVIKAYFPATADRVMPGCLLRESFDVRCPTCGTGTALMHLAAGEFREALEASWFAVAMLAALVAFDLYLVLTFVVRRKVSLELSRRDSIILGLAGFAALGLAWVQQLWIRP